MPLNLTMIGAMSTATGGAAVTALPVHSYINALGCALLVAGTLVWTRTTMDEKLQAIQADTEKSSKLNRKQVALLEDMQQRTHSSGPNPLPPPSLRRIV